MKIRIGTRSSKLALIQTNLVVEALNKIFPEVEIEIIAKKSKGDCILDRPLSEIGGKGLFIKDLEFGLLNKTIDIAVHSLKDVPGDECNENLTIQSVLKREEPNDVFVSETVSSFAELPYGAKIGTCAPRRIVQLLKVRPDLKIDLLRGNVPTRVVATEKLDGVILAMAGLKRLNMTEYITEILPYDLMLPAVGQGIVCIQSLKENEALLEMLKMINHESTYRCALSERSFLKTIGGDCHTPLGALATLCSDNTINMNCMYAHEEDIYCEKGCGNDPLKLGMDLAHAIIKKIA